MVKKGSVYKCDLCGYIVEVLHQGGGSLSCCDRPMEFLEENSTDAAVEKHVPEVERVGKGYKVAVGSVLHPMEDKHYIEWIDLNGDGNTCRRFLKPGDQPLAQFEMESRKVTARAYCNLHGYWKGEP